MAISGKEIIQIGAVNQAAGSDNIFQAFNKTAKNISYSRRVAHAHYKSDSDMGDELGKKLYNYTKNNNEKSTS